MQILYKFIFTCDILIPYCASTYFVRFFLTMYSIFIIINFYLTQCDYVVKNGDVSGLRAFMRIISSRFIFIIIMIFVFALFSLF